MEQKVMITRKDGIVYERKSRKDIYDVKINLRYFKDKLETLKEIANKKNTKFQPLIRSILDKYIEEETSNENI